MFHQLSRATACFFSPYSSALQQRRYIPSPLSSPAAARRLRQRLNDKICASPILSRVKRHFSEDQAANQPDRENGRHSLCGLLFLSAASCEGFSGGERDHGNVYLHAGGDTGRIANRSNEDKWDVW